GSQGNDGHASLSRLDLENARGGLHLNRLGRRSRHTCDERNCKPANDEGSHQLFPHKSSCSNAPCKTTPCSRQTPARGGSRVRRKSHVTMILGGRGSRRAEAHSTNAARREPRPPGLAIIPLSPRACLSGLAGIPCGRCSTHPCKPTHPAIWASPMSSRSGNWHRRIRRCATNSARRSSDRATPSSRS